MTHIFTNTEQKGDILSIYFDGESFKQFINFQKCIYMFLMSGILTEK
jgi:hypothetical protein